MSHKPAAALSGVSILSGIYAYSRFGSLPSLLGAFAVGGVMGMSSMRMRDNMEYGVIGAAASSAAMSVPTGLRAVRTRAPIPMTVAILALGSTAYYTNELFNGHKHHRI